MKLEIQPDSGVPIYVQIGEQVRAMVAAGQLPPGRQLPTIRQLAADLRVNYNTVARAYLDLDRDGVITTVQGRGTFVVGVPDAAQAARLREEKLRSIVQGALEEAHRLGYGRKEIEGALRLGLQEWLRETREPRKEG